MSKERGTGPSGWLFRTTISGRSSNGSLNALGCVIRIVPSSIRFSVAMVTYLWSRFLVISLFALTMLGGGKADAE